MQHEPVMSLEIYLSPTILVLALWSIPYRNNRSKWKLGMAPFGLVSGGTERHGHNNFDECEEGSHVGDEFSPQLQ